MLLKYTMKVNISLAQININAGNYSEQFKKVTALLRNSETLENHYFILPELWISGYAFDTLKECYNYFIKKLPELREIAKNKNINIIGSVPWIEKNKIFNRTVILDNSGNLNDFYDKIHLFKPLHEERHFKRGSKIVVSEITDFPFGVMICYDIRFPELAKMLSKLGAKIIFVSAEWPQERIEQWILLNRARAVENQIFIVACNRTGTSFNIKFGGNSLVIDPFGDVLLQMGENEEVKSLCIDMDTINKANRLFNTKNDSILI